MPTAERAAILLDGEFVKKALRRRLKRAPTSTDVMTEVGRIMKDQHLAGLTLYRAFYYTAEPLNGVAKHPLTAATIDFGATSVYVQNKQLIDKIENEPDVAVRRGMLVHHGWELSREAARSLTKGTKQNVAAADVVPKIQQKGVDMRIGLDIASLALKRLVSGIVVVTGDSDLVPAMKLARREGLRVFLDTMGSSQVRPELKLHADRIL